MSVSKKTQTQVLGFIEAIERNAEIGQTADRLVDVGMRKHGHATSILTGLIGQITGALYDSRVAPDAILAIVVRDEWPDDFPEPIMRRVVATLMAVVRKELQHHALPGSDIDACIRVIAEEIIRLGMMLKPLAAKWAGCGVGVGESSASTP